MVADADTANKGINLVPGSANIVAGATSRLEAFTKGTTRFTRATRENRDHEGRS